MSASDQKSNGKLDLEQVRASLSRKKGRHYWRALEELADSPEFQKWVDDEFPERASIPEIDRRSVLKFMGASLALAGLSGCRSLVMDQGQIVPYVKQPEQLVPGRPLYYASVFTHHGFARGVLVEQHMGRPTKIEGNPDHPDSLGASDHWMQASILSLYDPDRTQNVTLHGDISTWATFLREIRERLAQNGAGLRILSEPTTSPTLAAQIRRLVQDHPGAAWHQWDPCHGDNAFEAAEALFGRPAHTYYNLKDAQVVLSLDAEFLMSVPGSLRYAREFMDNRRVRGRSGTMNRLYAVESMPTITGATADHRFVLKASEVEAVARALAAALGVAQAGGGESPVPASTLDAIARDLQANRGRCAVIPGAQQTAAVHALAHAMNEALGNFGKTVVVTEPVIESPVHNMRSVRQLVEDMRAGRVQTLLILGGNPAYNTPADLKFSEALQSLAQRQGLAIHHTYHPNETSALCQWVLPEAHYLEAWGDARAFDGTLSIQQPVVMPLFEGRSHLEVVAALNGDPSGGKQLVQAQHRRGVAPEAFEKQWRTWLHEGLVPNTKAPPAAAAVTGGIPTHTPFRGGGLEVLFQPDPHVDDGRYSNNGWLQELPKPMTKITWDNVAHLGPKTAKELGVANEDALELTRGGQTVRAAAWVTPGHPEGMVTVHFGYGRTAGGTIARGDAELKLTGDEVRRTHGFNAYLLQSSDSPFIGMGLEVRRGSGLMPIASTQVHHSMRGHDILRHGTLAEFQQDPSLRPENSHNDPEEVLDKNLYPDQIFAYNGPQWGMTVDLNTCIGCNACVVACQAENSIPVVGKEQVKRAREMHWLRIDRYYATPGEEGDHGDAEPALENPEVLFQPMMCVHCEKAPCEPVCPVAATLHSHEGLNQMVYNRCVGTRYCSNNCPYKVRRFNYLNYSDNQEQFTTQIPPSARTPKPQGVQLLKMLNNPDVTVRGRGVMEKCTYCVQRINQVRIEAKKLGRDPRDGEIMTACQQACPTRTIVFGNVADPNTEVSKWRSDPRAYRVLEELQTRPRTSYLGRLRNPNPEITA